MRLENYGMTDECIKVYDPEKKELIATYDTYTKAERATGISAKILKVAVKTKTRRYSPTLQKQIAIRLAAKNKPHATNRHGTDK